MSEPDQIPVINVEKWDISKEIVNMMEINPWIINRYKEDKHPLTPYDPVVGKWMTNLVATTSITAKAMKSLYTELNRQKDDKQTYRKKYKDLQAVVTTTTEPHVTLQQPVVVTSSKVKASLQVLKGAPRHKARNLLEKERVISHPIKERKVL